MLTSERYYKGSSTYDWKNVYTYEYDEHGNKTHYTVDHGDDGVIDYEEERSWILVP